jgi:hypothetical protein
MPQLRALNTLQDCTNDSYLQIFLAKLCAPNLQMDNTIAKAKAKTLIFINNFVTTFLEPELTMIKIIKE